MIGLDTNVLIRYFAQDDPVQSQAASEVIESLTELDRGFVSIVALVEMSWVLTRAYQVDDPDLVAIITNLLEADEITVERPEAVRAAVAKLESGAQFADAVITELGREAGCDTTLTFDRRASERAGMRPIAT
jgi:predicted nucleic-acid-binding protein